MIPFEWVSASELVIREPGTEAISLAITYDPGWQATQSSADNTCQRLEITRDRLGQIVVFPKNKSQVNLKYQSPWLDKLGGAVIGLIMLVYLFQSQKKTAKSN